jgi:hypothetical protein
MMKIALVAAALAGAATLSALAPAAAHADTNRGEAISYDCLAFLESRLVDGHDWVYYEAENPTSSRTCEYWMVTYQNGSAHSHDYLTLSPLTSRNSNLYLDSGVTTQVCVAVSGINGSTSCSAAY